MNPAEAIEGGREILDPVMVPAGFAFLYGTTGKGSGGHFASASYRKEDRRLDFSYRWHVGAVEYHVGEATMDHDSYMRLLNVYGESQFSRFSHDVPLAGFEALRHDLELYCADFLTGPADEFCRLAAAFKADPRLGRGFRSLD
jgi:hypothetical protein